jgi:hypothetical protein
MKTIKIAGRDCAVDSDGVIDAPFRSQNFRYIRNEELREFRIDWYSGAQGIARCLVSRTVVRRLPPRAWSAARNGPAKRAA